MNPPPAAGKTYLGLYESLRFLGEGGMGKVFLGRHQKNGREVVIKVMHEHLAKDPKVRKSFERELETMLRFRHQHAVALLDGNLEGPGEPCLVMEFVRGQSLEEVLKRQRRLPLERVGRLLGQLALVLDAAHGAGILHRDLSPGNLMLLDPDTPREFVKVMDFGLSRANGFYLNVDKLQGRNVIEGGTPDYLCPEQIRGDEVDQRGDLYSVGVMLYEMLTGQVPFAQAQDPAAIFRAHLHQAPPSFAARNVHDVPAAIEQIVLMCLAKFPSERPQNARELLGMFEKALGRALVPDDAFAANAAAASLLRQDFDAQNVLDSFKAWMPEQVAIMKLRGFIEAVGGLVADSEPGLITMRVPDPRAPQPSSKSGGWSFWGLGRKKPEEGTTTVPMLTLKLHLTKKQESGRSLVEIAVILDQAKAMAALEGFGKRLCKELRAYLMIGHGQQ